MGFTKSGPLAGIRVLELGGIGPGPFGCMMLADLGATVIQVQRKGQAAGRQVISRGRIPVLLNPKDPEDLKVILQLAASCDVAVEGFRPGVAERLGVGPEQLHEVNPALVYGRMTGWGQDGPWAQVPGHDINYLGLTGALHAIGTKEDPVPPLNLVADFGGGGMLLAYGIVSALVHAKMTGEGQVVDAAMVDGVSALMSMIHGFHGTGIWKDERASNMLDGAAPFYRTYRCADGRHMAVGCIEPQFYAEWLRILGLKDDPLFAKQHDRSQWPAQSARAAEVFAEQPRQHWEQQFDGTDACTTPVLSMTEAPQHPHLADRSTLHTMDDGMVHPHPAPRFDRTPTDDPTDARPAADDIAAALREAGVDDEMADAIAKR
ncbi:CoA transferase [Epidermidibacterium keratini]|uniref:CoA transferase n=1 Tax=Epidermidibacterium keratini TaxID=1891644 RepID=A0A7L4YM53_9ACTN|nr:CaiB/BaiF CoA-transferase family protein [Epidermidibacterium keratini]QHC00132.1 CoA transferase [Epidermidibacterium keratini]